MAASQEDPIPGGRTRDHGPVSAWAVTQGVAKDVLLIWWYALRATALASLGAVAGWGWVLLGFMLCFTEEGAWIAGILLLCVSLLLGFVSPWSLAGACLGILLTSKTTGIQVDPVSYLNLLLLGAVGLGLSRWRRRSRERLKR